MFQIIEIENNRFRYQIIYNADPSITTNDHLLPLLAGFIRRGQAQEYIDFMNYEHRKQMSEAEAMEALHDVR